MPNDDGTPAGTPPETPAPSGTIDGNQPTTNWAAAYKTMQRNYETLQKQSTDQIAALQAQVAELTSKHDAATLQAQEGTTTVGRLNTQITDLTTQLQSLTTERDTTTRGLTRAQLIIKEFPDLALWEAKGLLPSGNDEDTTRTLLKDFQGALTGLVGKGVKDTMAGAVPPASGKSSLTSSGGAPDETEEYIWAKMMENAGINQGEFLKWQAKYDQVLASRK